MAKRVSNVAVKGELDLAHLRIKELDKNGDPIGYQYLAVLLADFDGQVIDLSAKLENKIAPSPE